MPHGEGRLIYKVNKSGGGMQSANKIKLGLFHFLCNFFNK